MNFVAQRKRRQQCRAVLPALLGLLFPLALQAGTLTVSSSRTGDTPDILGYNLAHFYPGSNTPAWFRYSGVTGARIFISPSALGENAGNDQIPPWGDGVTSQASFLSRKSALRASQLTVGTSGTGPYINWDGSSGFAGFNNLYTQNIGSGPGSNANNIVPTVLSGTTISTAGALGALRALGIDVLVNITASSSATQGFPITSGSDWGGKWELWLHYYAQAFYLAKNYDVVRYQMYNEPDSNAASISDFMMRLALASDAIQSAIADVNAKYGKSLVPDILAPVTAAGISGYYGSDNPIPPASPPVVTGTDDWGYQVVSSRHTDFLGNTGTNYWLVNQYDYHEYGSTPSNYYNTIGTLAADVAADMPGETPLNVSVSEFNTHTGANFATLTTTMDSPTEYSTFGAIGVNLLNSTGSAFYCFKFGQTYTSGSSESDPFGTVAKNGTHYVDNWNVPYNTGGISETGEVWRLLNKGFGPGRNLYSVTPPNDGSLNSVNFAASYDPLLQRYYLLCVNTGSTNASMTVDTSAWNLPVGNRFILQEVSGTSYGAPVAFGTVGTGNILLNGTNSTLVQPGYAVWLFTLPGAAQTTGTTVSVSQDAMVKDGSNTSGNYGGSATLFVKNVTTTTPSGRNATFLNFQLPSGINTSNIQLALLSVNASQYYPGTNSDAHVYGLPNASSGSWSNGLPGTSGTWSQSSITWKNAPNLLQGVNGGPSISNNFVKGGDDATLTSGTAAMMCGQLLVTSSSQAQYLVDVTDFLRSQTVNPLNVNFLIAREVRYYGDPIDADGISIVSKEGSATNCASLQLVLYWPVALSITQTSNTMVTLSWPASAIGWTLQQTPSLTSPSWTNVTTQPTVVNGQNQVAIAISSTNSLMFFRLSTQP